MGKIGRTKFRGAGATEACDLPGRRRQIPIGRERQHSRKGAVASAEDPAYGAPRRRDTPNREVLDDRARVT